MAILPEDPAMGIAKINSALRTDVTEAKSWLQRHERLIIVLSLIVVSTFLFNKYLDAVAKRDDGKAAAAVQQLALDQSQLADLKKQLTSDKADSDKQIASLQASNLAITNALASNAALLARNQAAVPKMTPTELSQTWRDEIKLQNVEPIPMGYSVGEAEAVATVQKLEAADSLAIDKTNLQQQVANGSAALQSSQKINADQTAVIAQQSTTIADGTKACNLKIDAVKADARKSKRNWFVGGMATAAVIIGEILLRVK